MKSVCTALLRRQTTKVLFFLMVISSFTLLAYPWYYTTRKQRKKATTITLEPFARLEKLGQPALIADETPAATPQRQNFTFFSTKTAQTTVVNKSRNVMNCELPEVIRDGVPWADCSVKFDWMKAKWKIDRCYAENGVAGDACSILKYLSEQENHCPPNETIKTEYQPLYFEGKPAVPRFDFQDLYKKLATVEDCSWIKHRIMSMEELWTKSSKLVFSSRSPERKKRHILVYLGLMKMGLGKSAWTGGPLGELVQWSDVIASLYTMGHDIVITSTTHALQGFATKWGNSGCPPKTLHTVLKFPFDIIYTDIVGYKQISAFLKPNRVDPIRCRFRIVDSFGTEASFNHPSYRSAKGLKPSGYNGVNLQLPQFNTMFPHTPDNTFLGFVTEFFSNKTNKLKQKRNIALIYGKAEKFWKGKEKYIAIVKEYVEEVHATVHNPESLPSYIVNHGIVNSSVLDELYHKSKIFVGLGFPFEGPAPLEAIQHGAVFLQPKFSTPVSSQNHKFFESKPTKRKLTSQHPYADKFIGKPHVYSVDVDNETVLRETLDKIINSGDPGSYLSFEFSARGMLERLSTQVEKQQFCVNVPYSSPHSSGVESMRWPPLSSLVVAAADAPNLKSCNKICDEVGLICEPSFFPIINRAEAFHRENVGLRCNKTRLPERQESDYPAFDETTGTCYLQNNIKLFSCAENYRGFQRLCPCRDFKPGQVALCDACGLS